MFEISLVLQTALMQDAVQCSMDSMLVDSMHAPAMLLSQQLLMTLAVRTLTVIRQHGYGMPVL